MKKISIKPAQTFRIIKTATDCWEMEYNGEPVCKVKTLKAKEKLEIATEMFINYLKLLENETQEKT